VRPRAECKRLRLGFFKTDCNSAQMGL
jgi:hypothetical protein